MRYVARKLDTSCGVNRPIRGELFLFFLNHALHIQRNNESGWICVKLTFIMVY